MADWPTIASLATAGGTLVLAAATFASVRSANRAARTAERSLQAGLRPLLLPTRPDDPPLKVLWQDRHKATLEGGRGTLEEVDGVIYLAASVRNSGAGIAVLHSWYPTVGEPSADDRPGRPRPVPAADPRPLHPGPRRGVLAGRHPRARRPAPLGRQPRHAPNASGSRSTCSTATTRAASAPSPALDVHALRRGRLGHDGRPLLARGRPGAPLGPEVTRNIRPVPPVVLL